MGSWARPEIPRLERVCQLCGVGTLGDERHLIFECPELLCFREQWSHLFEGPQTMQAFMWQEDLIGVAKFVTACLRKMSRWKARREGGTQTLDEFETRKFW